MAIKDDNEALILEGNEEEMIKTVNEVAEEGSEIQEDIISVQKPKLVNRKKDFVNDVLKAELGVSDLRKVAKEEKKENKKRVSYEWARVRDYVFYQGGFPRESSPAKLDVAIHAIAAAKKWLDFLGEGDILREWLNEYGLDIVITRPNQHNTFMPQALPDGGMEKLQEDLKGYLNGANDVQRDIIEKEERLVDEFYERLPEELKYSPENKRGLKTKQFNDIVVVKALKNIEEEKAKKKAQKATDAAMDSIGNNRLMFNLLEGESVD